MFGSINPNLNSNITIENELLLKLHKMTIENVNYQLIKIIISDFFGGPFYAFIS